MKKLRLVVINFVNTNKVEGGFASDETLINYCETHCETPRGLFHSSQVARMVELAGCPDNWKSPKNLYAFDNLIGIHEPMKKLVTMARGRG